jgi:transposase
MAPEGIDSLNAANLKSLSLLARVDELSDKNSSPLCAAEPLTECAQTIHETVRNSLVIASVETSARVNGKTHWQWTFVAVKDAPHVIALMREKMVPNKFLDGAWPKVWNSDRLPAQGNHADTHQFCLPHLIRDAHYVINAGNTVFALAFKEFRACEIGRRRPDLADPAIEAHPRELDRLLEL